MAITPQTNVYLVKVPLTLDNKNQLTFQNEQAQINYFMSLPKIEIENSHYQRKDNIIKYPAHIDSIIEYNYVVYQNENYTDKWFYAYITNMEYINDNRTDIYIQTDVWQTWQFDVHFEDSFIEREHVLNDTIGLHTIDENLNIGEIIQDGNTIVDTALNEFYWIAVETNWTPEGSSGGKQFNGISVYNKQVSGSKIYLFNVAFTTGNKGYLDLARFLIRTNGDGHIEDVQNIYIVPTALIDMNTLILHTCTIEGVADSEFDFYELPFSDNVKSFNNNISKPYSFSDYTPKNNKCFVYPYNYMEVTNNVGNINIYKIEDFAGENMTFKTILALSIGCSGKLIPLNYKGVDEYIDEGIPLAKYPTCSWSSNAFINWLTQNAVNLSSNLAFGIFGSAQNYNSNVSQGNSAEGAVNLGVNIAKTIADQIGIFYAGSMMPNNIGGENTGDVIWANGNNSFYFRRKRVKTEYLKIIDEFFNMYGYKVNEVKMPNLYNRPNWNYIKTTSINIWGTFPGEDLQLIKNMFDNGLTLWHNPNTFLDYSQNNN